MDFKDWEIIVFSGVITVFGVIKHFMEEDCYIRRATTDEMALYLEIDW